MQLEITWTELKSFLDDRNLSANYVEFPNIYIVTGVDHYLSFFCKIRKDSNADQVDFETNYKPTGNQNLKGESVTYPFANKKLPDGKSLFRRIHGIKLTTDGTSNSQKIIFTVPYNSAKITSTEIIGAELGDIIDFKILDTTSGTATGIPNYMLNQFGFGVYPSKERYEQKSEYDADLFIGLQLEITLTPVDTLVRNVYFNLVLHEVV